MKPGFDLQVKMKLAEHPVACYGDSQFQGIPLLRRFATYFPFTLSFVRGVVDLESKLEEYLRFLDGS